tara:strand:+ start:390 stop:614 length:225 start_codon:yes stop_codon:yes gene_type:complete
MRTDILKLNQIETFMLLRHLEGVTECIQESRMNDDDYPDGRPLSPKEEALHSIYNKVCDIYFELERQSKLSETS